MKLAIFFLILLTLSIPVLAQPRTTKKPLTPKPSGIYGTLVQIGFPPTHLWMGQSVPLIYMDVAVRRVRDNTEVARARTGSYGQFKVSLPPGRYIVEPLLPRPDPDNMWALLRSTEEVTVWAGFYSPVGVYYDGGW